ncbi:MAG: hypothetical protein M3446_00955 [Actinomycetota bacterium]|nr:hypothetical protein [Actinomycetota bacterium]
MARFLLLHSPLVGPRTLAPLADALRRLGHGAAVPDLRASVLASGSDQSTLRSAGVQAISSMRPHGPLIVSAHSGASAYLPSLAAHLDVAGVVLIDAVLPPVSGSFLPSADFRTHIDRLVEPDRFLPPWPQWWGEQELARLVADPDLRAAISHECVRVPIDFYDTVIDVPANWARPWAGYLRLSRAYEPAASAAAERGWPTRRRDGGHLDTASRPDEVADDLIELVAPILGFDADKVQ